VSGARKKSEVGSPKENREPCSDILTPESGLVLLLLRMKVTPEMLMKTKGRRKSEATRKGVGM
jgi:hypothetical protein